MDTSKLIGQMLIEAGAITAEQLHEGLELQHSRDGRICQILMSLSYLSEDALLECLGSQEGITSVHIERYTIDPALIELVPKGFAREFELMPLDRMGNNLTVAMAVPLDIETPERLAAQTGCRVRTVLCDRGAVLSAIEQYYGWSPADLAEAGERGAPACDSPTAPDAGGTGDDGGNPAAPPPLGAAALRLKNVLLIVNTLDQFPLLPDVHLRLLERFRDPEVALTDLSTLIERDPPLSANVLKIANSAAYVTRNEFESIQRAVAFLGLRELHNTVLASGVLQALQEKADADLSQAFSRAFQCGLLTKLICEATGVRDSDTAFTAGLLSGIGRIALQIFSPEYVDQIAQAALEADRPRVEVEEAVLGISTSELGYVLARRWNLPEALADTIRFHDRLHKLPEPPPLTSAVALAQQCLYAEEILGAFKDLDTHAELAALVEAMGHPPALLADLETRYEETREGLAAWHAGT